MPSGKTVLNKVFTLAEGFVVAQKADWGHEEWEKLLDKAAKAGVDVSDEEVKRNLGNILEGGKHLYCCAELDKGARRKSTDPA